MIRAVVFDLWDTLVEWRPGLSSDVVAQSAAALGLDPDEFEARWQETDTLRVGVISMCSEEVPELWPDTDLHGLFDSTVFSCSVGLAKPDPRIYRCAPS